MSTLKAAFMYVDPEASPDKQISHLETPHVCLTTLGVPNYAAAEQQARKLAQQGYVALELCAGFGTEGVAAVKNAAGEKMLVGVVRFDLHPGLGHVSGDSLYRQ